MMVEIDKLKKWLHERVEEIEKLPAFLKAMEEWYLGCEGE